MPTLDIEKVRGARGCVQLLSESPRKYKWFGPYWWHVKRILRECGASRRLVPFVYGTADDPSDAVTALAEGKTVNEIMQAAIERQETNAMLYGYQPWTPHPETGEMYFLNDPDVGA